MAKEQETSVGSPTITQNRRRKTLTRYSIEDLKPLNDQRKILLPENMPPSPPEDGSEAGKAKSNGDVKMTDVEGTPDEPDEEVADTDEETHGRRSLRRGGDRAAERQRKREEQERKKEAELAAAKAPKQSKQYIKLLKDIQKKEDYIKKCEEEIAVLDNDLREADCGRTRALGKDRFWNRYYWFERNGMPYGGLPHSSTAEAGYANGCIWVQGPDEMEREGYIDMPQEHQNEYKAKFGMTVPQRKRMEEGRTSVFNAHQWGYYCNPSEVDSLLNWLDPRGFNELKLRKEILAFKGKIVEGMESRNKYLSADEEQSGKEKEREKEREKGGSKEETTTKRMATRTKVQASPEPTATGSRRCLSWTNTMALDELGHLHSEDPPPPKPKKGGRKSRG